jgi:hypothetical protein
VALRVPTFGEISLPDPQALRRHFDDVEALSNDVTEQTRESADSLRPVVTRVVQTMIPALLREPGGDDALSRDDESLASYAYAVALGLCFASQEHQRGWTKEGLVDGRVHAAMAMARLPGGYGSSYFVQVGYWVGRTRDDGMLMLPGDWTS